jgi:hypothetical protein
VIEKDDELLVSCIQELPDEAFNSAPIVTSTAGVAEPDESVGLGSIPMNYTVRHWDRYVSLKLFFDQKWSDPSITFHETQVSFFHAAEIFPFFFRFRDFFFCAVLIELFFFADVRARDGTDCVLVHGGGDRVQARHAGAGQRALAGRDDESDAVLPARGDSQLHVHGAVPARAGDSCREHGSDVLSGRGGCCEGCAQRQRED